MKTNPELGRESDQAKMHDPLPGGLSRRSFVKTLMTATAMMGLPFQMLGKVVEATQAPNRPSVIWLHFQECTGCSESLLRSDHPDIASLLMDIISLEYHETLMAGSGFEAEKSLHDAIATERGKYILVVEGAIPLAENGAFCKVGGKTALQSLQEAADGAALILCIGTCSSFGGIQAATPNPTGAVGVQEIVSNRTIINIAGCPPNPYNFLSTVLYYLTFKRAPELDALKRPKFAYGRKIHEHCERRPHFDAGRFAQAYGDADHAQGHCLYKLGCKGPVTCANCSVQRFNDVGVWPVSVGHPCIGCTEPDVLFHLPIEEKVPIHEPTPFDGYAPAVVKQKGKGADPVTTGLAGLGAGLALGAGLMMTKKLPHPPQDKENAHHEHAE